MPTVTPDLVRTYVESDALRLAELVRSKAVTPAELTEVAISLIEQLDPKLNAIVIRAFDEARARAALPFGDGLFAGVPYLLKNIGSECEGLPMTAGLEYRKDYVCIADTEMVRRIKASGLNILGRTNTPENGWCIATEPRYYGPISTLGTLRSLLAARAAARRRRSRPAWFRWPRARMAAGRSGFRHRAVDWWG